MTKILEKGFKIFINVLLVIVVIIILIIVYGKIEMKASNHNYSNYFGYTLFKISSGSMGETMAVDDVVLVKITKDFKEGDVITFSSGDTFITHRVVSQKDGLIVTKGDANNTKDVSITEDKVLGKVVHVFRELGVWQKVFSTPHVFLALLITLILFDVAFSYKNKKQKPNKHKKPNLKIDGEIEYL